MAIRLFLDLNNLEYYGYIPEIPANPEGRIEEFKFVENDEEFFEQDIDEIDSVCNALLDLYDVEFFNAEQCALLSNWIEERINKPIEPRYKEILEVLNNYCKRAVTLNTGVVIEL